jgi:hypothetical protein
MRKDRACILSEPANRTIEQLLGMHQGAVQVIHAYGPALLQLTQLMLQPLQKPPSKYKPDSQLEHTLTSEQARQSELTRHPSLFTAQEGVVVASCTSFHS